MTQSVTYGGYTGSVFENQRQRRDKMKHEVVNKEGFTVTGLKYRGDGAQGEIGELWDELGQRWDEFEAMVDDAAYGVSANMDQSTGEFDYIGGVELPPDAPVPEGMVQYEVPGGKYAVFPTTMGEMKETFNKIFTEGLAQAGLRPAQGPWFELYDETFVPNEPESIFYIYVPVA
jgi:AraC family transcriptional regulator